MADATEEMRDRARYIEGLYVGLCAPSEYEDLVEHKLLRLSYEWPGAIVGLAKLRFGDAS